MLSLEVEAGVFMNLAKSKSVIKNCERSSISVIRRGLQRNKSMLRHLNNLGKEVTNLINKGQKDAVC